jgi:hypothetical protein
MTWHASTCVCDHIQVVTLWWVTLYDIYGCWRGDLNIAGDTAMSHFTWHLWLSERWLNIAGDTMMSHFTWHLWLSERWLSIAIFWDLTLCGLMAVGWCVRGTCSAVKYSTHDSSRTVMLGLLSPHLPPNPICKCSLNYVRFEVLVTVLLKVLWDVIVCHWLWSFWCYRRF